MPRKQPFTDLYLRHSLDDSPDLPYHEGVLYRSPDIIPHHREQLSEQELRDSWSQDIGQDLTAHTTNFIYVRGKNLADEHRTGRVYLYYSPASVLPDPQTWRTHRQLKTRDGNEYAKVEAAAGAIFGVTEPFVWEPTPEDMQSYDHFCLVARLATAEHANEIPDVANIQDFGQFIATNPDLAWRNVVVHDGATVDIFIPMKIDTPPEPAEYIIILSCEQLPAGTTLGFQTDDPLLRAITMEPVAVPAASGGLVTLGTPRFTLPGDYDTSVTVVGAFPHPPADGEAVSIKIFAQMYHVVSVLKLPHGEIDYIDPNRVFSELVSKDASLSDYRFMRTNGVTHTYDWQ